MTIQLFISTQCPHCHNLLTILSTLVKQGEIPSLEIINLADSTQNNAYAHIKSVPHLNIAGHEFSGAMSKKELLGWLEAYKNGTLTHEYIDTLLGDGRLDQIEHFIMQQPAAWSAVIDLLKNPQTKLQVRIGITALLETHADNPLLVSYIDTLKNLAQSSTHANRVDCIYYLSLIKDKSCKDFFTGLLNDDSGEIRAIAQEALETLALSKAC